MDKFIKIVSLADLTMDELGYESEEYKGEYPVAGAFIERDGKLYKMKEKEDEY